MIREGGKKGVDGIGNDQGDQVAFLDFQAAGIGIHFIVKLPDGVFHLLAVGFSDIAAVNDLGNRTDGNTGLSGHILDGWSILFCHVNLRSGA